MRAAAVSRPLYLGRDDVDAGGGRGRALLLSLGSSVLDDVVVNEANRDRQEQTKSTAIGRWFVLPDSKTRGAFRITISGPAVTAITRQVEYIRSIENEKTCAYGVRATFARRTSSLAHFTSRLASSTSDTKLCTSSISPWETGEQENRRR